MLFVYVSFHLLLCVEGTVADCATVTALAVVLEAVKLEHVVVSEVSQTDVAGIGPLARVSAGVHLELLRACKSFSATRRRTAVWFFSGVRSHVNDQLA